MMEDGKNPDKKVPVQEKPAADAAKAQSQRKSQAVKSYRIKPPDDALNDPEKLRKWQSERLTVKQGLAETPTPILIGYVLLIVVSVIVYISAYFRLPDQIEITQFFGASTSLYNKAVFLIIAFAIQLFLIYRDIVRRSLSKFLFLVPVLYFFLVIFLISSL